LTGQRRCAPITIPDRRVHDGPISVFSFAGVRSIRKPGATPDIERVSLGELIHEHVRVAIETAVHEELHVALGVRSYERHEGRRGYRNGLKTRTLTGPSGPLALRVPRATLFSGREWTSALRPRYQRRLPEANEAIAATYLAGGNTRRIRGALQPLLKAAPLSKSAVSRVVATCQCHAAAIRAGAVGRHSYRAPSGAMVRRPVVPWKGGGSIGGGPGRAPEHIARRRLCLAATQHPRLQRRPQLPARHHPIPRRRSRKRTCTYIVRRMRALRFLLVTRAGRLTRIGGHHVLRLAWNPATEALYARIQHALAA
jgi:hypothetical protein